MTNRPDPIIAVPEGLAEWFPAIGADVQEHRAMLKEHIVQRDGGCWNPGCDGAGIPDMHEAIRRSHVQGMPRPWRILVFTPFNCIALCRDCHTNREPVPEEIFDFAADYYGVGDVVRWLRSLLFKSKHPLAGWLRRHR